MDRYKIHFRVGLRVCRPADELTGMRAFFSLNGNIKMKMYVDELEWRVGLWICSVLGESE